MDIHVYAYLFIGFLAAGGVVGAMLMFLSCGLSLMITVHNDDEKLYIVGGHHETDQNKNI